MNTTNLLPCPHCRSKARIVQISGGYAIVCEDKNCLGQMRIHYGSSDDKEMFLKKLISDWNRRTPEVRAVTAAVECLTKYRDDIYDENQEEYSDYSGCCVDVLDEAINRLKCFTSSDAVEQWIDYTPN